LPQGADPIAQAYAGHQFGHFTMLGDGRAILLGEQLTPDGKRFDIQLKGSGRTPYSRRGDGRAALAPMLREFIVSEAMHALEIPTTRSLAVAATGEEVFRDTVLAGAVLTRVAASHIRVGTFQYLAGLGDAAGLRLLADYTLQRHFPRLAGTEAPYLALLEAAIERQASLVARWMLVGFVHGVMNTDNMALGGETIDYGPCAFMDAYDPATVFSSIDAGGRYAYGNQPAAAQWNLARFAETLLPLLHPDPQAALRLAGERIGRFPERYGSLWLAGMRAKLGLLTEEPEDRALVEELLSWMHRRQADYTNTFRELAGDTPLAGADVAPDAALAEWRRRWQARLARQPIAPEEARRRMRAANPVVIPRNHRVEEALAAAVERHDLSVMQRLLAALSSPFDDRPETSGYRSPPPPSPTPYRTFCGT
jgi:uncharacterized protein YdiU (UPF0061 family)